MFKTIFNKLTVLFICITIFSFSVAGVMMYQLLGKSILGDMTDSLNESGNQISASYISYIYNDGGLPDVMMVNLFRTLIWTVSSYTKSMIWIVNNDGTVLFSQKPPYLDLYIKTKTKNDNESKTFYMYEGSKLADERQYRKVMTGTQEYVQETGDFYGHFAGTNTTWLTIERPIKLKDAAGKNIVVGAVYLHTPIPEVFQARSSVFKFFMISVAVSFLISITLVYFSVRRITGPIKKINAAARVIAKGEFDQRVDIKSGDEVGQLARSFNNMASALYNHEEIRREFVANVSHELRTPMTSIRGFIEGILDGTIPPEKQMTYLIIVRDEIGRMNRMVNDLLDLSHMEEGEIRLIMKKVDINELIRRCVIKFEILIAKKQLTVEAKFESENMWVKADMDGIERVVMNLIHNAIKFTPVNGTIKLSTARYKDKVIISIEDNGTGIEENEIDRIWQRFYKTDKSRGQDKRGAGLGLAIVKSIINEHKQDIWVESEPGKGTKFSFTLNWIQNDEHS